MKTSEKEYLLRGTTSWFSVKHLRKGQVNEEVIKTLFTLHRNMRVKPNPNFNSIRHVGTPVGLFLGIAEFGAAFSKVCESKLFLIPDRCSIKLPGGYKPQPKETESIYTFEYPPVDSNSRWKGLDFPLRVNLKGGPNGPTLGSQPEDLCALKHTESHLLEPLARLWKTWGYNPDLRNQYPDVTHEDGKCPYVAGRLLALQDKSCKTRVVATLDNYTQIALRPVHMMLNQILGKFNTDFTEDQVRGIRKLRTLRGELWSIDLSNATDTLPVDLCLEYLRRAVPHKEISDVEQFVADVKSVLTDRSFDYNGQKIRYTTGQPMGAYASFPILALTNHLLVNMARTLAGLTRLGEGYAIVGDDIVISGREVAQHYIKLLESLKVPINHQKVVTGFRTFEFCRRIVRDGNLVSVPS